LRRELIALARLHGVVPRYRAFDGSIVEASEPALLAVLRALGVRLVSAKDAADALVARRRELAGRLTGPAIVTWLPGPSQVPVRPPPDMAGTLRLLVSLEQGGSVQRSARVRDLPIRGKRAVLTLAEELPPGVHHATLSLGNVEQRLLWIAAPRQAHPPDGRLAGLFAPLYALRSDRRPDCADLTDLEELANLVAPAGIRLLGTLPLDAAYLEPPVEPSPYTPVSRLFWNEAYLDVERLPEFAGSQAASQALQTSRPAGRMVDWPSVAEARRRAIEAVAEEYHRRSPGAQELRAFAAGHPVLEDYASFRALAEEHGRNWRTWPDPLPQPDPRLRRYHLYAQWRMHQQVTAMTGRLAGRDIGLYLDLPLGAHPDGFDAWHHPRSFLQGCAAGAPPDAFFSAGQDWGLSPPHPEGGRDDLGHGYFRDSLRHHMSHCRIVRLDHVMALHRVFCIPHGMSAAEGMYVRQPTQELFALLCLESQRQRCAVVGEDLGTVPDAVRRVMAAHGLLSMRILQFDLDPGDAARSLDPPAGTLAALNTHDTPTFAGFLSGADVDDRVHRGLLDEAAAAREHSRRGAARTALRQALELQPDADPERVLRALLLRLAGSEADVLIVNLEDLWLETAPQNVPGTTSERNWRQRFRMSLEELAADAGLVELLREIARARRSPRPRTPPLG